MIGLVEGVVLGSLLEVYWLECTETNVPAGDDWLTSGERRRLGLLKIEKRRSDWRLGRWTAKSAVACFQRLRGRECRMSDIEVEAAESGAPVVLAPGIQVRISLSHRSGTALCAVTSFDTALGCDIEIIEPYSNAFVSDFFSSEEQVYVESARAHHCDQLIVRLIWSGKESVLKAMQVGLRMDTRDLRVIFDPADFGAGTMPDQAPAQWHRMNIVTCHGHKFHGWWIHDAKFVKTIASSDLTVPIRLDAVAAMADPNSSRIPGSVRIR